MPNWVKIFQMIRRFIILFFLLSTALMALDPAKEITQYNIKIRNMESGLPGNSVFAITQTRDGYLWLGTQDGLVCFDGVDFELYDRIRVPQLRDDEIRALYEDREGNLWIGTSSGGLISFKSGEFILYPAAKHKSLTRISSIDEDRWGNLWIGSFSRGLTRLRNGAFTTYTTKDGLPDNEVNAIVKDRKGDLRVVTKTGIVKIVEPAGFRLCAVPGALPRNMTTCHYKVETEDLWIGTGNEYLFCLNNGKMTHFGDNTGIPHRIISCLFEDRLGNLWMGTDGGGLTRMNNGVISTLPAGEFPDCGFVYSIYEDREGSLWVGTLDGGLLQIRDTKFTTYSGGEGMTHDYINCVHESRGGDLYIGTNGGLNRLSRGRLTTLLTTGTGLLHDTVLSLFEDPGDNLWVGTVNGLHRFKDGRLSVFTRKHGLSDDAIICLSGDSRGNTWIGTETGLSRFNPRSGAFTLFTKKQGLTNDSVKFIFEDSRGTLLVGAAAGLFCFNDGKFAPYIPMAGFGNVHFKCVYEDKDRTLWFGSESGLIRLQGGKTTRFGKQDGLIENRVYSLLEDGSGYLWLAGRKGISRISKKELADFATGLIDTIHPGSYNEKDGMKSRWCTNAGCRTRDGRFCFPTAVGVAVIHPEGIKKNETAPPVIIKKFIVDGEPRSGLTAAGGIIKLAPGKKRFEIYYTGLSFINSQDMRFKIRLDGYDGDWVDMGTQRSTTYTRLLPGEYTFHAMACNHDGVWSEKSASFSFQLLPHFYQTPWFYIPVVLFGLLAIFFFYRFRVRQLRARGKELGALVELRTQDLKERNLELEQAGQNIQHSKELIEAKNRQLEEQSDKLMEMDRVKSRFFANISHEFRTPLTLIMGPVEQMLSGSSDETQKKQLNLVLRNSQRLLGLINQLLELSKFESGRVKLHAARRNVIPLLRGFVANFEPLAERAELDLAFHAEEEDVPLYIDAEKLEDIITNLLINAVKFTPAGGKITVAARRIDEDDEHQPPGLVEISVCDTGPGIPREQLAHIFDRFYQAKGVYEHREKGSGLGLALVKEWVQLHHGKIDVFSREGDGAEFRITLPSGDAHLEPGEIVDAGTPARPPAGAPSKPAISDSNRYSRFDTPEEGYTLLHACGAPGRRRQEEDTEALTTEKEIILVVEDSADVRDYIRGSLEPLYRVVEAADGREGLRKAQEIIPDLIISDILMPGIDGYELCKTLKTDIKTSHVPIILLTARAAEESVVRGLETGADDYITKPFSTKILTARIKNLINLRRQMQLNINREMAPQPAALPVSTIDREFMKELKVVINKNLPDPEFNVEQLAKELYLDRSTIYRKALALTGETPTDFIRSCRLQRGAELLKNNFGTVLEVALEVGFSSANYFSKCFKKKFHQLPSECQAAHTER